MSLHLNGRVFLIGVVGCAKPTPAAPPPEPGAPRSTLSLDRPAAWLRAGSVDVGCMLEEAGVQVDPRWRCGAPEPETGDPCNDIEPYYAGPEFPPSLVEKLPGGVTNLKLTWEHGDLQALSVDFAPGVDDATVRSAWSLDPKPENVMMFDLHDDRGHVSALLQGFDHMGAGDVDCGT